MTYRAPSDEGNDQRTVTIEFEDENSPVYALTIRARIREPLSIDPKQLNFPHVNRGQEVANFLQIRNHTERDIELSSVQSDCPWLSVDRPILENVKGPAGEARQVWRVPVRAVTHDLPSGWHEAKVEVRTSDPKAGSKQVAVHLQVNEPVEACPAQMFFGTMPAQGTARRLVQLRFSSEQAAPAGPEAIVLRHDLNETLRLTCLRRTAACWELSGTIAAGQNPGVIQGTIEVSFPGLALPSLKIPVLARVEGP